MAAINAEGVPCYYGSCSEIYLEKAFPRNCARQKGYRLRADWERRRLCSWSMPTLTEEDMGDTADKKGHVSSG